MNTVYSILAIIALVFLASVAMQPSVSNAVVMQVAPTPTPVAPSQKTSFTPFFYWYDAFTGAHLEPETLTNNPPEEPWPDWRHVDWYEKELTDMAEAGIDIVLPAYWGNGEAWSQGGLPYLSQAWYNLVSTSQPSPQIGMFFDTSIVNYRDLTDSDNKEWFYQQIRDFFYIVPWQAWGLVNGRPVVFLFTSDYTDAFDQGVFDHVYYRFNQDYGLYPYIVRETSWSHPQYWVDDVRYYNFSQAIYTDNSYTWGAALNGYNPFSGGVASVGPGYDDTGLPGREGWYVDRDGGNFYANNFWQAIIGGKPMLFIETWNEFHEATGISETVEYGRFYVEGTGVGMDIWKNGTPTPVLTFTPTLTATFTATPPNPTFTPTLTRTVTPTATARCWPKPWTCRF